MRVRKAEPGDYRDLLRWRTALWPQFPEKHQGLLGEMLKGAAIGTLPYQLFIAQLEAQNVGFIEVSLRSRADGCDPHQPVAYIEAWYVEAQFQGRGFGKALFQVAEEWARRQGCLEMASDTWLRTPDAQRAHESLGFSEVDRCIHYRKKI